MSRSVLMERPTLLLALAGLVGCNQYDLFRLSGYQQESFSNKADILFVVDNSDSMFDEAADLAVNFTRFIETLQVQEETIVREDLGDAVDNYKSYVQDRGSFVDFQLAITTTEIPGRYGQLEGPANQGILTRGDDDLAEKFLENLLCHATCIPSTADIGSDASYQCGDPVGDEITTQYLDCLCGEGEWEDANCATTGKEEGLEGVFMAMCRAVPNPPDDCFAETITGYGTYEEVVTYFEEADVLSNDGLLRPNATLIPVIVSDEGDNSRRENSGDPFPDNYVALYDSFNTRMSWVALAPPLDASFEQPAGCTGYDPDNVFRYDYMIRLTNGLKIDIKSPSGGECPNTDFGENLNQFGSILQNLLTVFELQSVPDPDTILVFVDGEQVEEAQQSGTDAYGLPLFGAGWSYLPEVNAVRFHGDAVPQNDANVQVFFDPIDGMPRELPY